MNLDFQLFPLQILFINLISDVLPALSLGMTTAPGKHHEPSSQTLPGQSIIDTARWKAIVVYAVVISICSLGAVFSYPLLMRTSGAESPLLFNNILFFTLIGAQLFHVFNMYTSKSSFFRSEVIRNKYTWYATSISILIIALMYTVPVIKEVLALYALTFSDWLFILAFSLLSTLINQIARTTTKWTQ